MALLASFKHIRAPGSRAQEADDTNVGLGSKKMQKANREDFGLHAIFLFGRRDASISLTLETS
ncbi:uncharacterized protein N7484_005502 [Penicillium longicatenatum]|uniref:uncharacterized protein n=1 Tax=Penicillium longicatenatum TaxID=1561947 RepID=UPI002548BF00|nr:uncharacterized protein N7484_005502 [Penicillium longicatenatum]KAJ5642995.1 hypothetical protein N7484_005502 [Penicillium longicatenatum]